jgi:hypothetical protein
MARKTEIEFIETLTEEGKAIVLELDVMSKSRKWLADQLGITTAALNYKLQGKEVGFTARKGVFKKTEKMVIKSIFKKQLVK